MAKDLIESLSGIRGIYGSGITEELAQKYVFSYFKLFSGKISVFLVAGDTRPSTEILKKAVIAAAENCGVKQIIDIGVVPIQVAEYAVQRFGADGGVYISASHNEPEYNGFKFLKKDGAILYKEQSDELIETVHKGIENSDVSNNTEIVDKHKIAIENYINYVLEMLGKDSLDKIKSSEIKILADPNGGASINILQRLFDSLGVEADIINNKLGKFNRKVEPNIESLAPLAERLNSGEYQFACGFDCDSDRVEIVLPPNSEFAREMGVGLNGNYVLALACDTILEGTQGEVVVNNDASSYLVRDVIKKYNATVKEVEVGEMNVVQEMERNNSLISGEGSSAGVIVPPIRCRDGIMAIVLILKMISDKNKSLLDILDGYPRYYQSKEKIKCSPDEIKKFREYFEKYFKEKGYKIQKTGDETGGLKAIADNNNFVWCRQSKTEPGAFRIWADGNNKEKVQELLQQGIEVFNKFKN